MAKRTKKVLTKIKTIELYFEQEFENKVQLISKRIQKQPTLISIEGSSICISFVDKEDKTKIREIELSIGYIDQICSTIRNLLFITGQMNSFTKSNLGTDIDKIIKNQTLLDEMSYGSLPASNIDIDQFFTNFSSTGKKDYYKYLINSIPWFILMEQKRIITEKYRILFTLIEMVTCCENKELRKKGQTEKRYKKFIDESKINAPIKRELNEAFKILQSNNLVSNKNTIEPKEEFTLTHFSRIVSKVLEENSNETSQIYLILYQYRCNLLHGSMSPIIKFSTTEYAVIEKLYKITRELLYKYMCNLLSKAIK